MRLLFDDPIDAPSRSDAPATTPPPTSPKSGWLGLALSLGLAVLVTTVAALVGFGELERRLEAQLPQILQELATERTPQGQRERLQRLIRSDRLVTLDTPPPLPPGWRLWEWEIPLQGQPRRLFFAVDVSPLMQRLLLVFVVTGAWGLLLHLWLVRPALHRLHQQKRHLRALAQEHKRLRRELERYARRTDQSRQAITHLAFNDLVTDLPNRLKLIEAIGEHLTNHSALVPGIIALITLDLDNFKEINDTLGHIRGDRILRELGNRLKKRVKQSDLVARLGGDEFGIVLFDLPSEREALEVASRIIEALEEPVEMEGFDFYLQASLGIALYPEHGDDARELLRNADIAMYRAKRQRTGLAIYDPKIDAHQPHLLTLKSELRQAINEGALQVFFQPKVDLSRGHIVGVESLVRWIHPERGFIGPDKFVPLAERSNLIHPMTGLVFNVSLFQCSQWLRQGMEIGVAVNCSAHTLNDDYLPHRIETLLYTWDVPPHLLTVELTESALLTCPEQVKEVLSRLAEMGVKVSVDDYGTGYSSLSYLKTMPFSELKIDRSFVSDMLTDENDAVIVRATIDMAHDLGLSVTAEGIEDQATWDALVELGCDRAQGFFMGKPQTAAELAVWLRESPFGLPQARDA